MFIVNCNVMFSELMILMGSLLNCSKFQEKCIFYDFHFKTDIVNGAPTSVFSCIVVGYAVYLSGTVGVLLCFSLVLPAPASALLQTVGVSPQGTDRHIKVQFRISR